jgi:phosphoglycerate dehydrogenase-like enzyme
VTKRVIVLDDYQGVARRYADWTTLGLEVAVEIVEERIEDRAELVRRLRDFEVIVLMRERTALDRALLDTLPNLDLILTTGPVNASIDLDAAAERGIPVWATRGFLPPATEMTWSLILACAKNLCELDRDLKAGGWRAGIGRDLHGATLGVIGLGYYGSEVARIAQAFGMEVIAWSENLTRERCHQVGARLVDQTELLDASDFVTVHLRLSDRTRGLIGTAELARMKRSAYLINTSRGPIVEEKALVRALEDGQIAGAGLDVFDQEPLPAEHPLRKLRTVTLTPHVGYVTERSYRVFFEDVIDNIRCYLDGRPGRPLGPSPRRAGVFYFPG